MKGRGGQTMRRRALVLIGSPKPGASGSASLAAYFGGRLAAAGITVRTVHLRQALRGPARRSELLAALDDADLIVLAAPLYEGSVPAVAVEGLELIAAHRAARAGGSAPGHEAVPAPALVALVGHGFPEPEQTATLLGVLRCFAAQAGLAWAGALTLPVGATLRERLLDDAPVVARHARKALRVAAEALAAGRPMPDEAAALMRRPMFPVAAFRFAAEREFRKRAEASGVAARLDERPYSR